MAVVIAIDGPAGSGKSTLARALAARLGYAYLDTGAMYRAVTVKAHDLGVRPDDAPRVADLARRSDIRLERGGRVSIDGEDVTGRIRTERVNEDVKFVAEIAAVRDAMVTRQRDFARANSPIVAEGRDMATVVFPDAVVKVYLDASPEERARRRIVEVRRQDPTQDPARIRRTQAERDARDEGRAVAPLRRATEAVYIDSTGRTPAQVLDQVLAEVNSRVPPDA